MISSTVVAEDIKLSSFEVMKECSSLTSDDEPFQYRIFEIFDGIIFADYNVGDYETSDPFQRLFKKLDNGEYYFRSAIKDQLTELTIGTHYSFSNTHLITEEVLYDYSQPNVCIDYPSETSLSFNSEAVVAHCEKKWTKRGERDEDQIQFCTNKQTAGFDDLRVAVEEYKEIPLLVNMFDHLVDKWTERGFTDYNQIDYEVRLNGEGFLNIEYELKEDDKDVRPHLRSNLIFTFDPKEADYSLLEYSIESDR
tara:strand:+ start:4211 stop:4966 length:756 start_codon:yes stop_codon:yes gene_type:complete